MARVQLTDSMMDVLTKMSDGNPGALTVMMQIMERGDEIDPDNAMGALIPILMLDTYGIYGSAIWVLYKDVCGEDVTTLLALLRARQLGIVSGLDDATDVVAKVQECLPKFAAGVAS